MKRDVTLPHRNNSEKRHNDLVMTVRIKIHCSGWAFTQQHHLNLLWKPKVLHPSANVGRSVIWFLSEFDKARTSAISFEGSVGLPKIKVLE